MREAIRILDLRDSPWVDGPGRTILETAEHLDRSKFELIVGGFRSGESGENCYLDEARNRGLPVREIEERKAFDFAALKEIVRIVKDDAIEVVHTHDFRTDVMGLLAAKRCGVPVVSTCHGWIANDLKGRLYRAVDRRLLRLFDHVITVSDFMKQQLVDSGLPAERLTSIPNALILDDYVPDPADRVFRKELGVADDKVLIVSIGRLSPEKGHEVLLRALAALRETDPGFVLAIVGKGPEEASIRGVCNDLGLDGNVRFVGFRSDMPAIYNSADLVVQSSFTEGMPNVVLEALLMETPVVATSVGGTAEIVEHGINGFLVAPDSADALSDGLRDYFENKSKHLKMAASGRVSVAKHFNHSSRVQRIAKLYSDIAGKGTP